MANITNVNYSARFSLSGGISAPTSTTANNAVGTGGAGTSIGTGSALPRNTTFAVPTLTSLATCSGLNGICAGTAAAPTSTSTVIVGATDGSYSADSGAATRTATADGVELSASLEHALFPAAVLILAMM